MSYASIHLYAKRIQKAHITTRRNDLYLFLWISDTTRKDSKVGFHLRETWRVVDLARTGVTPGFLELQSVKGEY